MARTTIRTVVERVRRQLLSAQRPSVNQLDGAMGETDTTVTFLYDLTPDVAAGAILDIGTETMRVMSVDADAKTATVIRGWAGSTGELHEADDPIYINPRWTAGDIFEALLDEVAAWPTSLFRVTGSTQTITDETEVVQLPGAMSTAVGVIDVRINRTERDSDAWPRVEWRLYRGDPTEWTAVSTSGLAIRLVTPLSAGSIYIEAALPFDISDALLDDDLETDYGMSPSLVDLAVMGAKVRLLFDAEAGRSQRDAVDASRTAEAVPPSAAIQAGGMHRQLYLQRRSEEIDKLRARYVVVYG